MEGSPLPRRSGKIKKNILRTITIQTAGWGFFEGGIAHEGKNYGADAGKTI
ncbi:hypothetical protein [Geosporobacter ferrireducens]|uniref:hypothetical protein n=1 Tax=Geosporobacter ferrireducens TaxID=1424294 RepID=UPI0012EAAE0B|nr:hypothetical protein [Geosporobacter ferrireducens]